MVNKMEAQILNNPADIIETMFHEFNDSNFYGLEYIIEEFNGKTEADISIKDSPTNVDWFGLSELSE